MAFISELSNTRRSIVCAVLTAAAAGPIVAVLNTAIMYEWWNASLTGADALETVVKLPVIMAWIGLVGLPVAVAIGVPSDVILAWRANACGSVRRLDREAMVGGATVSLTALCVLVWDVTHPTSSLVLFAAVGAIAGRTTRRLAFPTARAN